jgi:hypothetical protein
MNLVRRLRRALIDRGTITFCDACGQACDGLCRAEALRQQARSTAMLLPRL